MSPFAFQTLVQFLFQINPLCKSSCSTFRCQVSDLHFARSDQFCISCFPHSLKKKTHPSSILKSVATCHWIKPWNTLPLSESRLMQMVSRKFVALSLENHPPHRCWKPKPWMKYQTSLWDFVGFGGSLQIFGDVWVFMSGQLWTTFGIQTRQKRSKSKSHNYLEGKTRWLNQWNQNKMEFKIHRFTVTQPWFWLGWVAVDWESSPDSGMDSFMSWLMWDFRWLESWQKITMNNWWWTES